MFCRHVTGLLVLGLIAARVQAQDAKVYSALTAEQLESTLKGCNIEFKKIADKKANTFFYDYKAKTFNLRLYYEGGQQLVLDTLFAAMPLEKVNDWNLGAKFCRAGLGKDDKGGSYTVVESHLNLKGGLTEGAIKEYLKTFVEELDQFQMFAAVPAPRKEVAREEKTFKEVPADLMEKVLEDLKIKHTKVPLANGVFAYQYQSKESKIVLTNWGKDLMLEAKFPRIPLEKVNQYNLDRKFIRTVSYNNKKGEYTGLEANLSFAGGISDSILRSFIAVFEEDAREFALYVKKASE